MRKIKESPNSHQRTKKGNEGLSEAEMAWNKFYTPLNGFAQKYSFLIIAGIYFLSLLIFFVLLIFFNGTLKFWQGFLLSALFTSLFYWPSFLFLIIRPETKKLKHEEDVKNIFIETYPVYSKLLGFIE